MKKRRKLEKKRKSAEKKTEKVKKKRGMNCGLLL